MSLETTIANVGYAKVLVRLNRPDLAAAARNDPAAIGDAEQSLQSDFIMPNEGQRMALSEAAAEAASSAISVESTKSELVNRRVKVYPRLGLAIGYVDEAGLGTLKGKSDVDSVSEAPELSLIRPHSQRKIDSVGTNADPDAQAAADAAMPNKISWGITHIGADKLWAQGYRGKGVRVGHLDTGIDGSHPALQGAIAAYAEFDLAGNQVQNAQPRDSGNHGTHTAGTIVGRPNKTKTKWGEFGVAPETELVSAMVIEGGQLIDRILGGLEWMLEQKIRILNMSLGLRGFDASFQPIIDALRAADVLPVIATGNEGPGTSRSPGNYPNVLSIGAMDRNNHVPSFSSSQKFLVGAGRLVPDLVAPGVDILSCVPGGGHALMNGSSMATPHIAGLAALLMSARPHHPATNIEQAILASCTLPAGMFDSRGSYGVPNALRALTFLP